MVNHVLVLIQVAKSDQYATLIIVYEHVNGESNVRIPSCFL